LAMYMPTGNNVCRPSLRSPDGRGPTRTFGHYRRSHRCGALCAIV
jgi:hypothetical protein